MPRANAFPKWLLPRRERMGSLLSHAGTICCPIMKRRYTLFLSSLVVALLVSGCGLWVWQAKRQYALNRELIAALAHYDSKQALSLVNAGADPNTRCNPPPAPSFKFLLNQLLRRLPPPDGSPTAFMLSCGQYWLPSDDGSTKPINGWDDLHLAAIMLTHGADVNAQVTDGDTALTAALYNRHVSMIELLLKHGANINAPDSNGMTPLMLAAHYGYAEEVEPLLASGANINMQDQWGNTALHHCFGKFMDKDTIKLLIAHGANPRLPANTGATPLTIARLYGFNIVALLHNGEK